MKQDSVLVQCKQYRNTGYATARASRSECLSRKSPRSSRSIASCSSVRPGTRRRPPSSTKSIKKLQERISTRVTRCRSDTGGLQNIFRQKSLAAPSASCIAASRPFPHLPTHRRLPMTQRMLFAKVGRVLRVETSPLPFRIFYNITLLYHFYSLANSHYVEYHSTGRGP